MSESTTIEVKDLKKAWEDTKNLLENEFKAAVKTGEAERKKFGEELGQTKEKHAKMELTIQTYEKAWEEKKAKDAALEAKAAAIEAKLAIAESAILELKRLPAGGKTQGRTSLRPELKKFFSEEKAFSKFMATGEEWMSQDERKALATDSDVSGGFLTTEEMANTIIELNVLYSPIRQVADVMTISKGDTLEIPREGSTAFSAAWTGERTARTETTSGTFANIKIPTHELGANPWATQKMLDDGSFDVEGYIARKVGEQFGKAEGTAFVNGSGVGQPQGLALGGSSSADVTTASGAAMSASLLMTLQHLLEEPYASRATWLMKRSTLGAVRALSAVAGTGDFFWQPGITLDKPPTLLGSPYVACNDIQAFTGASSGDKLVYYGDIKAGYKIVDRLGIRVLRDPFTNKPNVEFTTYKRVGGQVVLPEAIKIGTRAA